MKFKGNVVKIFLKFQVNSYPINLDLEVLLWISLIKSETVTVGIRLMISEEK